MADMPLMNDKLNQRRSVNFNALVR